MTRRPQGDPFRARGHAMDLAPALTGFEDQCRAGEHHDRDPQSEGLRLDRLLHHDHRIPAPSVRAVQASSATAKVKRARICFTNASLSKLLCVFGIGGWAISVP
jgi:hypothetical protein